MQSSAQIERIANQKRRAMVDSKRQERQLRDAAHAARQNRLAVREQKRTI
jgi:hypothetical protein